MPRNPSRRLTGYRFERRTRHRYRRHHSTLRFYEEKGLIASIGRAGLRRVFEPGVLERLAPIAVGRIAGFSLDEIALMFAPDGRIRLDRQMLRAKAEELDNTSANLRYA
jgi:DNA-binding transcriptional MerR regulator